MAEGLDVVRECSNQADDEVNEGVNHVDLFCGPMFSARAHRPQITDFSYLPDYDPGDVLLANPSQRYVLLEHVVQPAQ